MQKHVFSHRSKSQRFATLFAVVGLFFAIGVDAKAAIPVDVPLKTVVAAQVNASGLRAGRTLETPNQRFQLGIPPQTVEASEATVEIQTAPRSQVNRGKRKLKTKKVYAYTIDEPTKGPVWVAVKHKKLKRSDTLKYYDEKKQKWKKIHSTVKPREGVIQGAIKKREAKIGVFQKKKRKRKKNMPLQGQASWYVVGGGVKTAAHKKLPMGTIVRVTNRNTGKSVDVTIKDRGPYVKGRIVDLSKSAFREIAAPEMGVANVNIRVISRP